MEQKKCKKCAGEIYAVLDIHGQLHELDATAAVYHIDPDFENRETACRANAFVEHRETCIFGRKAKDIRDLARQAGYV